jgi:peptide/nickel transport system permease protein
VIASAVVRSTLVRLALAVPTFIGITFVTFALMHAAPGDPAAMRMGTSVQPAAEAELRRTLDLDAPFARRYLAWLGHTVRFDFGTSWSDGRAVRDRIAQALPTTFALALIAVVLIYGFAVPLGWALAAGRGRAWRIPLEAAMFAVYGVPTAAAAMLALRAGAPYGSASLLALVVAAGCIAYPQVVRVARVERAALLDTLTQDFILVARSKGASEARVFIRHALPAIAPALVALLSTELPVLLSGSVLVEAVFGLRGLGGLAWDAVVARDRPLLLGLASTSALVALGAVLIADLLSLWLDPRLREESATAKEAA